MVNSLPARDSIHRNFFSPLELHAMHSFVRSFILLTKLPATWNRVVSRQINSGIITKKIPARYETRTFTTLFITTGHWTLRRASLKTSHILVTHLRSILALSSRLRLPTLNQPIFSQLINLRYILILSPSMPGSLKYLHPFRFSG
jgi:hypothetical protein